MNHTIRVVVLQDGELFVAQGLEVDVAAQGQSREQAVERLKAVLLSEARDAEEGGSTIFDIGPAPDNFTKLYESRAAAREQLVA